MTAIVPSGPATLPTFDLSPEFLSAREDAIASVSLVARVTNAKENELASAAVGQCLSLTRAVEAARKKVKEPVLDLGRRIDAISKAATDEINAAMAPVQQMLNDFAQAERERAAAEARRIERERQEAERVANAERLAAEMRAQAELDATLQAAKSEADRAAAEAKATADRLAAEEAQRKAQELAAARAAQDMQANAPSRAAGQTVKLEIEIAVTDLWALARAHPACVKIEPRLSEIKALIDGGVDRIPGVTWKRVAKTTVRTAKQATLDV
jgi:hypothetical protein